MSAQESDVKEEDVADTEAAEVCILYSPGLCCVLNNIHVV